MGTENADITPDAEAIYEAVIFDDDTLKSFKAAYIDL